ncbi:MAG: hypothetical protein JWO06_1968 [Bacteroidota bacterium]|nr:hypothetical protein [Bacteroidota bacterium]
MKSKFFLSLGVGFLLAVVCGNLSAQNTQTTGKTSLSAGPQAVTNCAVTNPDVLVVTGRILDAVTKQPIENVKINFDKFGDELLQASIDVRGNYAIALNKKELGEPIRVVFKIAGYKRYVVKSFDKTVNYLTADIYLQPIETDGKSNANIKYVMTDDPFNTMVIKMQ